MSNEKKIYFKPGDVVQLRQKLIEHIPRMLVIGIDNKRFITESKDTIRGVRCCWFTTSMELQEAVFSTKDLELVEPSNND